MRKPRAAAVPATAPAVAAAVPAQADPQAAMFAAFQAFMAQQQAPAPQTTAAKAQPATLDVPKLFENASLVEVRSSAKGKPYAVVALQNKQRIAVWL